jgi:retinoid hydroxylase
LLERDGSGVRPAINEITRDYGTLLNGLVSVPLPIPGTPYGRARATRDRLLARIRSIIPERRQRPGTDALSRMLSAKAADGRVYTDDEALLEIHHILIASFIVYALMAEPLLQLALKPRLRERCLREVREHAPEGPITLERLKKLRTSACVVLETKRFVPLVPLGFARAKRTFEFDGYTVPENWTVYLALWLNNRDPAIYTNPGEFDPDRFSPQRAEYQRHPMDSSPQVLSRRPATLAWASTTPPI